MDFSLDIPEWGEDSTNYVKDINIITDKSSSHTAKKGKTNPKNKQKNESKVNSSKKSSTTTTIPKPQQKNNNDKPKMQVISKKRKSEGNKNNQNNEKRLKTDKDNAKTSKPSTVTPPPPPPTTTTTTALAKRNEEKEGVESSDKTGLNKRQRTMNEKLRKKLAGSRFRWINEQLYTTSGKKAKALMDGSPDMFDAYHQGFRNQVKSWPQNPVDKMIKFVNSRGQCMVIGDFGCGDARLAASVSNKVFSFDLISRNKSVIACDIANVPIDSGTLDIAVFSLSLMGTNFVDFLKEASRTLKPNGVLKIAEVKSRIEDVKKFIKLIEKLNFKFVEKDDSNTHFIDFEFIKNNANGKISDKELKLAAKLLKPCLYKRR